VFEVNLQNVIGLDTRRWSAIVGLCEQLIVDRSEKLIGDISWIGLELLRCVDDKGSQDGNNYPNLRAMKILAATNVRLTENTHKNESYIHNLIPILDNSLIE